MVTNKNEFKIIDARGRALGRIATEAATFLMGKDNPGFKRHANSGSPVKIVNAKQIRITSKKLEQIYHTRYSGYPGGLKIIKAAETVKTKGMPELVRLAVREMLPDNKLRKQMMKNLTIEN